MKIKYLQKIIFTAAFISLFSGCIITKSSEDFHIPHETSEDFIKKNTIKGKKLFVENEVHYIINGEEQKQSDKDKQKSLDDAKSALRKFNFGTIVDKKEEADFILHEKYIIKNHFNVPLGFANIITLFIIPSVSKFDFSTIYTITNKNGVKKEFVQPEIKLSAVQEILLLPFSFSVYFINHKIISQQNDFLFSIGNDPFFQVPNSTKGVANEKNNHVHLSLPNANS